ncbi:hypothetical protein [Allocoleopsis sp.]|uniref:hypothetical protein n=1 Tax=Allocoleopsis sp. TaxID=3088169 RepID=UPI002FD00A9A
MSQNVSTNPKEREPLSSPTPIKPWSAEAEADKLMDELFSDIDQILEGGNRLPTEPAKPEYVSLKSIVIPQLAAPPAVMPPQEKLTQEQSSESEDSKLSETVETSVAAQSSSRPNRFSLSLERLLLVVGVAVLAMSLILLLAKQKKLTFPSWVKPTPSPSVHKSQVSQSDAEFAQYMERALKAIDNKIKAKQQATVPPGGNIPPGSNTTNPSPPSGNSPLASSQPQRVIERVYIPVYPPQNPAAPSGPSPLARSPVPTLSAPVPSSAATKAPSSSVAARRPAPSPSPAAKRPAPSPSPAAKRSASTSPQAAAPVAPRLTLPVLPTLPPSVMVPTVPMAQAPTSATKHTLVGVMEQGDRSAALFNAAGVTRYIFVGEGIGDSGWTLVSVANQEAVIRRNGEVRSVYAGQSF